ncbi:MAG: Hcp family type VI secretion system effector [Desulfobacterales bacterium]
MPMTSHMEVTGKNQGKIDGSCEMEGRESTILVYSMDHSIHIPKDPQSGLPSGKRIHGPLTIEKEIDRSSPMLNQALCTGERLSDVTIKKYRIDPTGAEEHYYTIKLEDAVIVEMEPYMPLAFLAENEPYRHMEKVSFTYSRIKWKHEIDGIESEDSWKNPAL